MDGNDKELDTSQKRKRGRPGKKNNSQSPPEILVNTVEADGVVEGMGTDQKKKVTFAEDSETPSVKKGRGRPPKSPVSNSKRGRPRKYPPTPPRVPSGRKPGRPRKIVDHEAKVVNNGKTSLADAGTDDVTTDTETVTPKRPRGRPAKPKSEGSIESSVKRSRGRPRKNFSTPGGESSVKRSRGRPPKSPLSKILHSSKTKRGRGRPPKTPLAQLLEATLVKKKKKKVGRPRKDEKANEDGEFEFVAVKPAVQDIGVRTRIPAAKQRGRPPKHGSPSTRLGHTDSNKKKRPVEISATVRSGMYLKSARQPPAILPAQDDLMMEEVVKRFPFMDSVVKVFCIHTEPNFSLPWQMKRQFSSNSSGFIISGRRVLTNAHSVQHHTQVKVKKRGSDTKYLATVLAIGTECDIALLTVNDDEFWEGVPEVTFGGLPSLQDAVTVVGYPIGGDTISVTSGVVSRIEVTSYAHGVTELLGVQIDAAINAGNSGGPAFNAKGQCVGIAFQSLKQEDVENIGYIIPTPVINHFINDYERNGDYTGFPILGIEWQKMENPDLRKALGMELNQKGVLVRRVEPTAPAAKFLRPYDIILSFDDIDVANDGTVPFRHGERIGFSYLVSQKYTGEIAKLKIMRGTSFLEFEVQLETHKRLVPVHIKGLPPSYYIVAGIVFAAVSVPYLRSEYGKDYNYDAPVKLLDKLLHSMALSEDEQLVVVSQVLVADINIGYEDIVNTQVLALNGVPLKNLKHLASMVETCEEEFMKFDLEYDQVVVLETKRAKEATPDILATHCIPSALSEDLK